MINNDSATKANATFPLKLSHEPHNHYILHVYAAIYNLIDYLRSLQEEDGNLNTIFDTYPLLGVYCADIVRLMPMEATWDIGSRWWQDAIRNWEQEGEAHLPLKAWGDSCGYTYLERLLLITIGLVEDDWRFGSLFQSLQVPLEGDRPTIDLLERLTAFCASRLQQGRPPRLRHFIRSGLIKCDDQGSPHAAKTVRLPLTIWETLRQGENALSDLKFDLSLKTTFPELDELVFPITFKEKLLGLPHLLKTRDIEVVIVRGMPGSGRFALAGNLAQAIDRHSLYLPAPHTSQELPPNYLGELCTLAGAVPILQFDLGPGETATLPDSVETTQPVIVLLGLEGGIKLDKVTSVTLRLPDLDQSQRRKLWEQSIRPFTSPELAEIAERFHLPSGHISYIARLAKTEAALSQRTEITLSDIRSAGRELNHQQLDALATSLPVNGTFYDLIVDNLTYFKLNELLQRCRHRERIAEHLTPAFGVEQRVGVRALFSGPSGTGKTLAARIIAAELGKDLYRVDLASIVNKYIGETEKNLHRVLTRAESLDVILLFDEGDALLGGRTEVRNANDRYANLETNYLLQRLEHYRGIIIVTTNLGENIDSAFQRRMDVSVQFMSPGPQERRQILELHLPAENMVSEQLLDQIAVRCPLNGGQLRNAVMYATLLALENEIPINDDHLELAVTSEYRKIGALSPLRLRDNILSLTPEPNGVTSFIDSFAD